jgi:hypothetical protein
MDWVFDRAKKRATDFMDLYLGKLEAEWDTQKKKDEYKADPKDDSKVKNEKKRKETGHKELLANIEKARMEWNKVKNWQKPAGW